MALITSGLRFIRYNLTGWDFASVEVYPTRPPTAWTVLRKDGPNHLGLWYNIDTRTSNGPNHPASLMQVYGGVDAHHNMTLAAFRGKPVYFTEAHSAAGEAVILTAPPPVPFSRCSNRNEQGGVVEH